MNIIMAMSYSCRSCTSITSSTMKRLRVVEGHQLFLLSLVIQPQPIYMYIVLDMHVVGLQCCYTELLQKTQCFNHKIITLINTIR